MTLSSNSFEQRLQIKIAEIAKDIVDEEIEKAVLVASEAIRKRINAKILQYAIEQAKSYDVMHHRDELAITVRMPL